MFRTPSLKVRPGWIRTLVGAGIGLVAGLVLTSLRPTRMVENIELRLIDLQTAAFTLERPPDPRIVLCEILEEDVAAVMDAFTVPWPWNLELTSFAFRLMADAGVNSVMLDIYQLDNGAGPDDYPGGGELSIAERQSLEIGAEQAMLYQEALRKINRVALAFELSDAPQYEVESRVRAAGTRLGSTLVIGGPPGLARSGADLPVRRVLEGATLLGFANVDVDEDGIVRRAPVVGRWGERRVLSLPLAALLLACECDVLIDDRHITIGASSQRVNADGSFLVNFHPEPGRTFPRVAPAQILEWARRVYLEGEPMPQEAIDALRDKIVVWGVNLAGFKDIITAPVSGKFHGPEFQATVLDNMINGDGRVRADASVNTTVLLLVTVLLGALAAGVARRWAHHVLPFFALVAGVAFAIWRFRGGVAVDIFTPFLGVVLTWGGTSVFHLLTAGRRNRWLEGTFGRYLAPAIISALKDQPELLELGGRKREITILFSDVAGFTKLTEALEPQQMVTLLNRYLTPHAAAVMEQGGVVDKFIGDAVMAFFGDPLPDPHHAEKACRAALKVQAQLPELKPLWEELGLADFQVRVGVNSGEATVGNMGSQNRFDYTAMGDEVNLASRLEGANKAFGTRILLGSRTRREAGAAILAKPIAGVVVVGRSQPEPVYELLALAEEADDALRAHAEAFERARAAAREGALAAARTALAEAERLRPGDGPCRWFAGVLDAMERGDEPSPWSGVVVLSGK